jgi:hypothetical protein
MKGFLLLFSALLVLASGVLFLALGFEHAFMETPTGCGTSQYPAPGFCLGPNEHDNNLAVMSGFYLLLIGIALLFTRRWLSVEVNSPERQSIT